MGCDIHIAVEKMSDSGAWEHVAPPEDGWFDGRNYHLFTALADVRNEGTMLPLMEPRGLPSDAAEGTIPDPDDEDAEWLGEHSFSWCIIKELYDLGIKTMPVPYTGVIEVEEYDRWKSSGDTFPRMWSAWTAGPSIVVCEESELFMSRGEGQFQLKPKATHVRANWCLRGEQAFKRFLAFCSNLESEHGGPDRVRLVFGFDS
jgi:hypothetical protein